MQFSYIQHFNVGKGCSFSVPSWLEKENSPAGLEHVITFLQNVDVKKKYFEVVHN